MANSWFDFKQFRIEQDACGMKVSTDACIQGAWTPVPEGPCRMLDVGAGTGLLSLMLAQRAPDAFIDALEMEEAAAAQAAENIARSPFADRMALQQQDVRSWQPAQHYDLIICNPPFFNNSLTGPEAARNKARHNLTLQQEDLVALFDRALAPQGTASVLLPVAETEQFTRLAEQHRWLLRGQLSVKDTDEARVKRIVSVYGRSRTPGYAQVLVIKERDGRYTETFRRLMQPFYLHL